ncbi:hypothetical protein Vadar_004090 [Vaccinium darrowii]|uniref:Uncharacterized protein n=1 Tax=Vaccinium darrowii TaxID=229202 RepID=A0ACB7WY87_9ERIC|nr:hypothetical protein Vadar_004090 [Vaccinium darrowii]
MFRLEGSQSFDASHVNTWVAVSLVCGVQELDLFIRIEGRTDHALPRDLFTSRTMVVLKLGTGFVMNVPPSVCMQSLKILHLHSVELIDDDSIYRLICGCPVLDELSMKGCVGKDVHVIHIFAPVLTKLFIRPLVYYYHFDEVFKHKIALDTPALLYLELETDSVEGYLVKNLSHLVTVNIGIGYWPKAENFSDSVTDLFVGISSIQCLHAYSDFLVVLHQCNYHLPMFHNLTSLRLYMSGLAAWETMFWLLQKSPRLETLVFSNGSLLSPNRCWDQPQNVSKCLGSHLKVVEIFDLFEWEVYKEELKMVEYFLKNAEVLKKLIIHSGNLDFAVEKEKAKVKVLKKLLSFPRGSKVCQIVMR